MKKNLKLGALIVRDQCFQLMEKKIKLKAEIACMPLSTVSCFTLTNSSLALTQVGPPEGGLTVL